jgi:PAS domain-containing protein
MPAEKEGRDAPLPEALVRSALESLGEGVTLCDQDGRIVYSNPAADRILGMEATEAPADSWAEHYGVYLPDGSAPFPTERYPLLRALAGEETSDVEMLIRNAAIPEGAIIAATGRPVRDEEGEIIGASVVFRDVTRLRSIEDELRRAMKALEKAI